MRVKVKSNAHEREFVITGAFTADDEDAFFDVFLQVRRQSEPQMTFNLAQCPFMDTAAGVSGSGGQKSGAGDSRRVRFAYEANESLRIRKILFFPIKGLKTAGKSGIRIDNTFL